MAEYYVVRDKNTGLYFRGKGVNRWGKYYNQASIYRIKANAENTIKEVAWRGEQAEIVPIQIIGTTSDVVEVKRGEWKRKDGFFVCSNCDKTKPFAVIRDEIHYYACGYCPKCGAKMDGGEAE